MDKRQHFSRKADIYTGGGVDRLSGRIDELSCFRAKENGDVKEFSRRFVVAAQGILGYELDLCRVSEKVKELFAEQIRKYNAFRHLIENGKYAVVFHPDSGCKRILLFFRKRNTLYGFCRSKR